MSRNLKWSVSALAAVLLGAILLPRLIPVEAASLPAEEALPMPPFTHSDPADWLNSEPLGWEDLRGKVVLVDIWTFDCWNCYRSIPWLHTLEKKFPPGKFTILGVHTPELPQEYVLKNVKAKVKEFEITHPVMIDNDYSYWNALKNRYWPAFYLVDAQGRVRARFVGETHVEDRNARAMEKVIGDLIDEAVGS